MLECDLAERGAMTTHGIRDMVATKDLLEPRNHPTTETILINRPGKAWVLYCIYQ